MTGSGVLSSSQVYPWLDEQWAFFLRRLENERLAHAILIEGPADNGKLAFACAMASRLLCLENQPQACGQCRSCNLLTGGAHPDCFDLQPEEGSEVIKVDQIRHLIGRLDLTTSISRRKVALVHPAENMNAAAANALLKSLEEPTGDAVLILVSDNPGRLPVTIRSRCQSISVAQPDRSAALDWLERSTGNSTAAADSALQAAGGSPLRAARYLDSPELDAYTQVKQGLATLLGRPASVSMISSQLIELDDGDLWRWLSICTAEIARSGMTGLPLDWLPANINLSGEALLKLQKQADINRQLSSTPVRGDLLLQSWLIKWAEQII
jgi:DNA polymerase-3 subunit delta'